MDTEKKTLVIENKTSENGEELTVVLAGRLDTTTAPLLEEEFDRSLDSVKTLVLDIEKLDYMSSAGLRVLLATQKRMMVQGSMKVVHVNETIMEIFDLTGFVNILTIE